jgi:hypothetical protein
MNSNQNLYFYGLWAKLLQVIGVGVMIFSIFLIFVSVWLVIIGFIIGIVIIVWG